ncbi:MAG: serine hydrolase domain-containing protein, partial [Rhodoferax sp.]
MHYAKGALLCALGLLAGATSAAAEPAQACPGAQWSLRESAPGVDRSRLAQALDAAMADGRVTRAIVVVYDGAIVAERYAPGYGPDSVFFSYSMAKSFTATLAGILVSQGRLALHAAAPVPEWSAADDPRRSITLAHLLNMSSGIATNESADQLTSDVAAMLFGAGRHDVAHYAANHPLKFAPGSYFAYSNSSSNVISGIIRRSVGDDEASYRRFIDEALFRPLGMASAVASFD